jgi:hypothetical protein
LAQNDLRKTIQIGGEKKKSKTKQRNEAAGTVTGTGLKFIWRRCYVQTRGHHQQHNAPNKKTDGDEPSEKRSLRLSNYSA